MEQNKVAYVTPPYTFHSPEASPPEPPRSPAHSPCTVLPNSHNCDNAVCGDLSYMLSSDSGLDSVSPSDLVLPDVIPFPAPVVDSPSWKDSQSATSPSSLNEDSPTTAFDPQSSVSTHATNTNTHTPSREQAIRTPQRHPSFISPTTLDYRSTSAFPSPTSPRLSDNDPIPHLDLASWLSSDLWCCIMSWMSKPGPLIIANKHFHRRVYHQWKRDPPRLAEFLRCQCKCFHSLQDHALFKRLALRTQARVVEEYMHAGGDVVAPVHWAAMRGCPSTLKVAFTRLKAVGNESALRDVLLGLDFQDRKAPIHRACYRGHLNVVQMFLDMGVEVNVTDADERTPLHFACDGGQVEVVRYLIQRGAKVNAVHKQHWSALHYACENGHPDVVKVLLEAGADVNMKENNGWAPLHSACQSGHLDVIKLLLRRVANVNVMDRKQQTPLHIACWKGHQHVVRMLLNNGANAMLRDQNGDTALHQACAEGHTRVVKALLDHSVYMGPADHNGLTPLQHAMEKNQKGVVDMLLWHRHMDD